MRHRRSSPRRSDRHAVDGSAVSASRTDKVTARVSTDDAEALARIAELHGTTVSSLIANRLGSLIGQHEPRGVPNEPHLHESAGTV